MAVRQALGRGLLTRRQLDEEAARRMRHTTIDRALAAVETLGTRAPQRSAPLDQRLKTEAERTGIAMGRLRSRIAFELFVRRLVKVSTSRWVLKGAFALDLRLDVATRTTKDIERLQRD